MGIVYQADNSNEMSKLFFIEKIKKKIKICCLLQLWLHGALKVKEDEMLKIMFWVCSFRFQKYIYKSLQK